MHFRFEHSQSVAADGFSAFPCSCDIVKGIEVLHLDLSHNFVCWSEVKNIFSNISAGDFLLVVVVRDAHTLYG